MADTATNYMDDLTDGVLLEILIRLPCKSANQFKSVSKRWLALISSPYFVSRFVYHHHNHLSPSSLPLTLLFHHWTGLNSTRRSLNASEDTVFKSRGFSLSFLPCFQPNKKELPCVIGSFNDLLLCCSSPRHQRFYFICNPFTMQWVELPATPKGLLEVRVGFICDPYSGDQDKERLCTKINTQYRYKVVLFPRLDEPSNLFKVDMFSSETGNWSESVVSCSRAFSLPLKTSAIAYNGMLHWWTRENSIVVFDPYNNNNTDDDRRSCHFIDPPIDLKHHAGIDCFGVCQGRLRVCQVLDFVLGPCLSVWELKDYDTGEWHLVHKIFLKDMVSKISWIDKYIKDARWLTHGLAFHPNDKNIVYFWLPYQLVLCNMQRNTLEVARESADKHEFFIHSENVFSLTLKSWPTPVHKLSQNALAQ